VRTMRETLFIIMNIYNMYKWYVCVRGVCVWVCVDAVERVRIVVCLEFESRLNLSGELCTRQHASVRGQLKLGAKLPDLRRKQHAIRRGGVNEDVSVSVRVSSALRLASDSRRGQNTVFCLLPTNESDGRRATLHAACSSIFRYALNVSLTAFLSYNMFIICMCIYIYILLYIYIYIYIYIYNIIQIYIHIYIYILNISQKYIIKLYSI